jgi:hypothetical protein
MALRGSKPESPRDRVWKPVRSRRAPLLCQCAAHKQGRWPTRKGPNQLPPNGCIVVEPTGCLRVAGRSVAWLARPAAIILVPLVFALAGCGGATLAGDPQAGVFSISPGAATIDTNCTGCNDGSSELFSASGAGAGAVSWSVSGGDAVAGPGTISATGVYTPPPYLTADSAHVTITGALGSGARATATLVLTPGFLQPLTPENAAIGPGASLTVTGYVAEAGGTDGIDFALSNSAYGSGGGQGSLSARSCVRKANSGIFTYCTVTYTAPATISQTATTYIVASIGNSSSRESAIVLLNAQNVESNPALHQAELNAPIDLGSSGGNNEDYDTSTRNGQTYVADCCGGTLGALVRDESGNQYLLSNNHVLARSDQAQIGEAIVQPGLIDDNCTPYDQTGAAVTPVGVLTGYVPIKSAATNVDAAIAAVDSGAVNASGSILELGARQSNGMLSAAPPGISTSGGRGENATLGMTVAKSGRTTGLTCASISALALDVEVSYYEDCAETRPYYTKTYKNQIAITGNQFSDAGDSGSLVVDTANAEPVGLFFAGGVSENGQSEGVANPAGEVLSELSANVGNGASYTFVGGADHQVSCLNYGSGMDVIAQARALKGAEIDRAQQAVMQARTLVNARAGILGVAMGKSSDHAGEGAVIVYVDPSQHPSVPQTIGGLRTEVIPASAQAVAMGTAPRSLAEAGATPPLAAAVLHQAIAVKQQIAEGLMKQNPAFFGVGVGQSLDNPSEAALVIYVDRSEVPAQLPPTIGGLRTRYVVMERLHVTRSYLSTAPTRSHCMPHLLAAPSDGFGLVNSKKLRGLSLY